MHYSSTSTSSSIMAFFLLLLCISSLLLSSPSQATIPSQQDLATTPADSPEIPQPLLDSPPSPSPDENGGLSGSPGFPPAALPFTAPVVSTDQPFGQQPDGGLEQDQQQQLGGSVSGGEQGQGQLQGQGQQALGLGALPLVDNTPFDSGSSRMGCSLSAIALGFIWSMF